VALGATLDITNSCFVDNDFVGPGAVILQQKEDLIHTSGNYGTADAGLTCDFLSIAGECQDFESSTCLPDPSLSMNVPSPSNVPSSSSSSSSSVQPINTTTEAPSTSTTQLPAVLPTVIPTPPVYTAYPTYYKKKKPKGKAGMRKSSKHNGKGKSGMSKSSSSSSSAMSKSSSSSSSKYHGGGGGGGEGLFYHHAPPQQNHPVYDGSPPNYGKGASIMLMQPTDSMTEAPEAPSIAQIPATPISSAATPTHLSNIGLLIGLCLMVSTSL